MRFEFIASIESNQKVFGLDIPAESKERLADYYELVQEHNALLHLVAPCSPEEFATRHILESLTLLEYLPQNATFADIGAGAGLPSIPCLIVRKDLNVELIESKEKKTRFLEMVISQLGLGDRAAILNRQFEETDPVNVQFITCRALDRFTGKLPRILKWSKRRKLLLYGGESLREAMLQSDLKFEAKLLPMSRQRFLFIVV